jgi:putative membrane protein insertion efficiency factor
MAAPEIAVPNRLQGSDPAMRAFRRRDARPNLGQRGLIALLTIYRTLASPWYAGSCRYVPSCSQYAREAIIEHGALRGGWLAMRRLARCNPLGSYGFDPVPQTDRITRS